jgi:hypothetical protein
VEVLSHVGLRRQAPVDFAVVVNEELRGLGVPRCSDFGWIAFDDTDSRVDARGQEGTERSLSSDRKIEVAVAIPMNFQRSLGVLHRLRADVLASAVIDLAARLRVDADEKPIGSPFKVLPQSGEINQILKPKPARFTAHNMKGYTAISEPSAFKWSERCTNLAGPDNGVLHSNSPVSQRVLSMVEG